LEVSMKKASRGILLAAIALSFAGISTAPAISQPQTEYLKAGTLNCDISAGIGLIIGSQKEVTCLFMPVNNAPQEVYVGVIRKFGLDIGATGGSQMIWAVYAPTNSDFAGLAGTYAGATAEATVGAGLGANVLLGGSNRTVALQPLSVQGQVGLNVAAGVASLELRPTQH
jgi:hypothetical protein